MNKDQLRMQVEQTLDKLEENSGQLFLYSLLNFNFEYDEQQEVVRLEVPISEIMYNPIGLIHGGMITYIADTAMGHLCAAFAERPGVSLELKTQFFRSVKTGSIKAEASFIKKGSKVQFVECVLNDDQNRAIAKATATFLLVD